MPCRAEPCRAVLSCALPCCAVLPGLCSAPALLLHVFPAAVHHSQCCCEEGPHGQGRWGWQGVPACATPRYALDILQTKALIDKLQKLVSSEGRFKNLREALKK